MKAITYGEFGTTDVLRFTDVDEPHAGPGQVRLKIVAAAVNPADSRMRRGEMQQVLPVTLPAVAGVEAAGIVDEVGEGVDGFGVGDEVLGWTVTGSYAEYALSDNVGHKPAGLAWEAAAALPSAVETSDRVLEILKVVEGETLLVHGGAGVCGAVGVQLALARGAVVVATSSEANHDYLRSLGAIPVTYGEGVVDRVRAAAPQGVDAVYDAAGCDALDASVELRGGIERIVTIADLRALELGIAFSFGSFRPFGPELSRYADLAADGGIGVRIDQIFPLADAAQAQAISEGGHARGKLLLRP